MNNSSSGNPIDKLSSQYFLTIMDWEVLRKWEEEDKARYNNNLVSQRIKILSIIKQVIKYKLMNFNRTIIAGRISNELTLKMTPSGVAVLKFSLAINKYFQDKDGNKQEKVSFIPCIAWKGVAERISTFCSKGDLLMLEGEITVNEYENKEGKKTKSIEILVTNPQFAPKPKVEKKEEPKDDDIPLIDDVQDLDISDINF